MSGVLEQVVARSAAPGLVELALARLGAAHPGLDGRLGGDRALAEAVAAVTGASRSLTLLLETDPAALDVLAHLDQAVPLPEGWSEEGLVRWKRLSLLRIAARDLLGQDDLAAVGAGLADLAAGVLDGACRLTGTSGLAVIGMGKLGGRELNYASDVDVVFVGDDAADDLERAARQVISVARQSFRVDANLRPEGRNGRLVRTTASYEAYWERWAQPWEFQALLKARPVAGAKELGDRFCAAAARHLWARSFPADDLRSLRTMKARAEREVERKGLSGRDLKRSVGGIRDIEFAVQLLQLVHGRHDPALRVRGTIPALAELGAAGYVDRADAAALDQHYRFLRGAEHRLQLVDEQQTHTLPGDRSARERLARTMGFRDGPAASAVEAFDGELARRRAEVRAVHERLYFRPLLEAFAGAASRLSAEATEARLAAFGFADAERTRQAVRELTRGLTRSSRLMHQLLPLLLGWLADSPDPDVGLLGLRTLSTGAQRSSELARAFRESPETARRLCTVLGTSRLLGSLLERNPDLIAALGDDRALEQGTRGELIEQAAAAAWRNEPGDRHAALRRLKDREVLRIAMRDVLGLGGVDATAADLTTLAEAAVAVAVAAQQPPLPFAVVALGRFGGGELSYASDLDVIFVYDGDGADAYREAEQVATGVLRFLGGSTPAGRIYPIDAGLRPEGRHGALARSLAGYREYTSRWAQVWERQATMRARPVAGDADVGQRFLALVRPWVWGGLSDEDVREIRRVKARVERERIPPGEDPQFHLKLGRGALVDVEFTAQLLQLRHGVEATSTMEGLARLGAAGVLSPGDTDTLARAYRFCERTRNRWYLVKGGAGDALPQQAQQLSRLARALDTTPVALREEYRRVTRRARAVVERVFYGRG